MLEKLRQQLADLIKRMKEMSDGCANEKGEVRSFTKEESESYSGLEGQLRSVEEAIKREEKLQEAKRTDERLNEQRSETPRLSVTREHNHNEQGEYRGFPEMKKGGFGEFLQEVRRSAKNGEPTSKIKEMRAALGANETVDSEGGFLIQSDHAEQLFSNVTEAGTLAAQCTQVPMSSNKTDITLLDETSLAEGSIYGGVQAFWRSEAGSVTATKPKFKEVGIKAEALEALFYATEEQLEDAPQLAAFANMAFANAMADKLDDSIYAGDGAGKPLGVVNAPCTLVIAKESGQANDTVVYANIDNMIDRLLSQSKGKAKLFIHPDVRKQMRNMVVTPGSKTDFLPFTPGFGFGGLPYDSISGYQVQELQACSALGDKGDILLADFSKYLLFKRSGIAAAQSMHVAFLTSQRAFKWTMRVNGMPLLSAPITDKHGSTTRAPFVTLAAR